jgi:hypothetical protein
MNYRSFALLAASLTLIGGGCSKISDRFQSAPPTVATSTAEVAPPDLTGAEYFLRSRDDVAPGQLDVTNQTLFAKTKNGQIVPVIKDVHEALGGKLSSTSFLVQVKELPQTLRYIYFVNSLEGSNAVAHQLYVFDTEMKKFADLPLMFVTSIPQFADLKFSPDHTKVTVFEGAEGQIETVNIFDIATGEIVNRFLASNKQTILIPDNSGARLKNSDETKWIDNTKFSVALFDRTEKSNGNNKPVDTVVIDTAAILDTSKFENLKYSYDENIDTLFARPMDKEVAVAVLNRVSKNIETGDVEGQIAIYSGVTQESPFVFFKQTIGKDSEMFVGIFEKRTGKMISTKPLEGKMVNHSVLSKSGRSLAIFSMMEKTMDIQLVDLVTLHSYKKSIELNGLSPNEVLVGMIDSLTGMTEGSVTYGPNKWLDDKTFSFNLYEVVDITKKADKNGKFSVKQPLAKTIKIKFE